MYPPVSAGHTGRAPPARDSLACPPDPAARGAVAPRGAAAAGLRGWREGIAVAAILLLALLFVSPGSTGLSYAGAPRAAGAPTAVPGHPLLSAESLAVAPSPAPGSSVGLVGSNPLLDRSIDAPALASSAVLAGHLRPLNESQIRYLASPTPVAPASPVRPATSTTNTGCPVTSFTGYVKNYSGNALAGVSVQANSMGTCLCPQNTCPVVSTTANGSFSVKGPIGADYLTFILAWYLSNSTNVTGIQGVTTAIAYTIYMVQESTVIGTVEANTSKHAPIAGVEVKVISRDLNLVGNPTTVTGSNGYFKIGAPPVPSQVQFSPPYGYLPTYADINSTPGEIVNLGVIYLDKEPLVTATLYDAVTGGLLPTGNCAPYDTSHCHSLVVCSSLTNACLNQGPSTGGDTVQALGPFGYDFVKASAVGYIDNDVPIGFVNTSSVNVGKIYMVPLGGFEQVTWLTTNSTTSKLPSGLWYDQVCSMNGYTAGFGVVNPATYTVNMSSNRCMSEGCVGPSKGYLTLTGFPLRNDVNVYPDTVAQCAPSPTWPIPGDLPVWGNETYVNTTPDMVTPVSYLNLTPGNYVYGNVTDSVTHLEPTGGFTVQGQSTQNPTIPSYSYIGGTSRSTSSPWDCSPYAWASDSFCAPVPPGPGELRASSLTASYADNYTWGATPYMCCASSLTPLPLWRYTAGPPVSGSSTPSVGVTTLNLTAEGQVYGRVFRGNTSLGVFFGSVQVAPAGSNSLLPSFDGPVYINGSFWVPSAAGWVSVTASASGFSPDTVWAYVTGNDSVGNISLTPLATVSGQVKDPTGHGIYDAAITYCPATNPTGCSTLGSGSTTSDGVFNGTVTGGWLPWATYIIKASSSGYTSDWTWVNATPGQTTITPTLTLYPVGTNTSAATPRPQAGGSLAAGVWVDGYLRDTLLDMGVVTSSIQACPQNGLACDTFNISNQDGYFNDTVPPGNYNLYITPGGYVPVALYFNATQAAVVHIGNVPMEELPWVTGYGNITPFGEISVKHGASWTRILLSPGANAFSCNANGTVCGLSLPLSSQGLFQVQTGGGIYNKLQVTPSGSTVATSPNGGFSSNSTIFNATTPLTNLSTPIALEIYTMVQGYVLDNSTVGPGSVRPWLPVRWAPVAIATFGPNHASVTWTTNGGGWYLFFVPAGPSRTIVAAGGTPEADIARNTTLNKLLNSTVVPTVYTMEQLNLTDFGWVLGRVSASPNGSAAYGVGVTATYRDPQNGTLSGNFGLTNGGGYFNVTAPPGHPVVVQVGPAADFNGTNFTVWVNSSQTTYVNGTQFWGLGNVSVNPWGWVRSESVNNTMFPSVPTVVDSVNQLPLPYAAVTVSNNIGASGATATTNWNGQFLVDAPISGKDSLVVTRVAYLQNTSVHVVKSGEVLPLREVNLTGVGFLAGTVIGYPSNARIPFATVQSCPYNSTGLSNCYQATANATGVFWVAAVPGLVSLTVDANGYVPNGGTVARSCSDCWNWLQPIVLNQYSYVVGTVRGLPSGLPLLNATVSACSPLGHPVGACGFTTTTPAAGVFTLAVPAGQYVLEANHTGYNSTYLPVGLVPGEILPVGILFLKQFGTVYGQVLSSATLLPVSNASVIACAVWSGGACASPVPTDSLGHFVVAAAPGPYTLAVLAQGFQDGYASATFKAGVTTALPPILITPLGIDKSYNVTGRVVNASNPSQGIGGATVSALVNRTVDFSTFTRSDGSFTLPVLYGVYTIQVSANGYQPTSRSVLVHGPVSGLLLPISLMLYNVTGTVTDGLTHEILSGVAISENGIVDGVTDVNGQFSFPLANGTHSLVATYEGGSAASYAPLPFTITVNGVPVVHDLQLVPPSIAVQGSVVDAVSDAPLAHALVTVRGITSDGVPVDQTLTADALGNFVLTLPLGEYNLTATFTGYTARTVGFSVTTAGVELAVPLAPAATTSGTPAAPSGTGALYVLVGALAVIVVALVGLGWLLAGTRRGKAAAPRPRPRASGPTPPPKGGK